MSKASRSQALIALAGALLLLLASLQLAYAEGEGSISGKVENKTGGGGSTAGLTVSLRTYAHQADGGTATTTTDQSGSYRFENLSTANTFAYGVIVGYQGVDYGSDLLVFESGEKAKAADLAVYETTDKADGMGIDRSHVIVSVRPETQTLSVTEILVVTNSGDRAVVPAGAGKWSLRVGIPPGAQDLQLEPNLADNSMAVGDGFAYAGPVLPGNNQLMYAYDLPYQSGSFDLVRSYDYPIRQLSFLMPEGSAKATSATLQPQEALQLSNAGPKYMHLRGDNVPALGTVTVRLEGLPMPSPLSALGRLPVWALAAGIGVGAVAVVGIVLLRRRGRRDFVEEDEATDGRRESDEDAFDDEDVDEEYAADEEEDVERPRGGRR